MYDPNIALSCAEASKIAYDGESTYDLIIEAESTTARIIKRGKIVIIAFKGTKEIKDIITDMWVARSNFGGYQVHAGFCIAYKKIKDQILNCFDGLGGEKLYLTGHSLGGALATLAAYDLDLFGIQVDGIYTFGCPRVGDKGFAAEFNARFEGRSYRIINDSDVVCRVPSMLRFRHVNQAVFFHNNKPGKMLTPPWWYGAREVLENIIRLKIGKSGTDHFIDNYIKLLS